MAAIRITGKILSNGATPDTGSTIQFLLSGYFRNPDNEVQVPRVISAELSDDDGSFEVTLQSTRDGVPATRFYRVIVRASFGGADDGEGNIVGGVETNYELSHIQIRSTPSDQTLEDLLADTLIEEGVDRLIVEEPTGDIGAGNVDFYTTRTPVPGTFMFFNSAAGLMKSPAAYSVDSSGHIAYVVPPVDGDFHVCIYRAA